MEEKEEQVEYEIKMVTVELPTMEGKLKTKKLLLQEQLEVIRKKDTSKREKRV